MAVIGGRNGALMSLYNRFADGQTDTDAAMAV